MEESIKNAERLIESANAALVQMKCDASRDDFEYILGLENFQRDKNMKPSKKPEDAVARFLGVGGNGLNWDKLFGWDNYPVTRKNRAFNSSEEIEKINNKIETYKREIVDEESPRALQREVKQLAKSKSNERILSIIKTASDTNLCQKSSNKVSHSAVNITEDLKSKLLQTQEIVDRGIQTARELSETVESFKSKSQVQDCSDEPSFSNKSKSWEKLIDKSDQSRSSVKTVRVKRCKRCHAELTSKRLHRGKNGEKDSNVSVMKIRGKDAVPFLPSRKNLLKQQLPSLNIPGDLNYQKIPSVDIPPGKREYIPSRSNTGFEAYSHEQILRDRMASVIDDVKKSNSFCSADEEKRTRNVECHCCGNVLKVSTGTVLNSERIDELLRVCNYNVFDPRIDKFVEIYSGRDEGIKGTQSEIENCQHVEIPSEEKVCEDKIMNHKKDYPPEMSNSFSNNMKYKIREFSKELTRKYKEKAAELESNHMRFESVLRDLFRKIDESRELFQDCEYEEESLRDQTFKRRSNLCATPPVILSYTGSGEEVDDGQNAVIRPTVRHPTVRRCKKPAKDIKKRLEKRELSINCKVLSSFHPLKDETKSKEKPVDNFEESELNPVSKTKLDHVRRERTVAFKLDGDSDGLLGTGRTTISHKVIEKPFGVEYEDEQLQSFKLKAGQTDLKTLSLELNERKESKEHSLNDHGNAVEKSLVIDEPPGNTESDYESDFEDETAGTPPDIMDSEHDVVADVNSYNFNQRLSTIAEVDSEIDLKTSDLVISSEAEGIEEFQKSEEQLPPSKIPPKISEKPESDLPDAAEGDIVLTSSLKEDEPKFNIQTRKLNSSSSSSDDDTRKLLKKVNRELNEVELQQLSTEKGLSKKKIPHEVTQSLMEVLDTLKSQFERTESLADKLTESIREVKTEKFECKILQSKDICYPKVKEKSKMIDDLLKMRIDLGNCAQGQRTILDNMNLFLTPKSSSARTLLDEEVQSVGRSNSPTPKCAIAALTGSGITPPSCREAIKEAILSRTGSVCGSVNKSYSEGEISEQEILMSESCSPSIGEVINESGSPGSTSSEKSIIQFK